MEEVKVEMLQDVWSQLQDVFEKGETLVATVTDVVKGGLLVNLDVRGFIPASHVDRKFIEDISEYKGRELTLKIIEINPEKNRLVLSHKAVLEEEANHQKKHVLGRLEEGQVLEGEVQRLTDFGVFVDIGGVDGLIHVSELAWHHVKHPSEVLDIGDKVTVKVLRVDRERERISLSLKETLESPWNQVAQRIQIGNVITGQVKRLVSFGAFIEVFPGVEGLVHISQMASTHVNTPSDLLKEGQQVEVKVLDLQPENERMSLSIKEVNAEKKVETERKKEVSTESFTNQSGLGVTLGDMYPGLVGLSTNASE